MNSNTSDLQLDRKRASRELEKQFSLESRREYEQSLQAARRRVAHDEALQQIITWHEVLIPLGGHATAILNAWTAWQYKLSHGAAHRSLNLDFE